MLGWTEPYVYTVYERMFGGFPAKNTVYTPYIYMVLANPRHVQNHNSVRRASCRIAVGHPCGWIEESACCLFIVHIPTAWSWSGVHLLRFRWRSARKVRQRCFCWREAARACAGMNDLQLEGCIG